MNNHHSQVANKNTQQASIEEIVTERVRTITAMIDGIRCSQDIKTIFEETTEELRHLLNSDRLIVYQFNPDWSGRVVAESVATGWVPLLIDADSQQRNKTQKQQAEIVVTDDYLQETKGGLSLIHI